MLTFNDKLADSLKVFSSTVTVTSGKSPIPSLPTDGPTGIVSVRSLDITQKVPPQRLFRTIAGHFTISGGRPCLCVYGKRL